MKIEFVTQSPKFRKQWIVLPTDLKKRAQRCIEKFRENPFHPSLRLHQLSGKLDGFWSISIDLQYRIIFEIISDTAFFHSIGTHAIYGK